MVLLSEYLGHSSPESTKVYAFADTEMKRQAIQRSDVIRGGNRRNRQGVYILNTHSGIVIFSTSALPLFALDFVFPRAIRVNNVIWQVLSFLRISSPRKYFWQGFQF